VNTGYGPDSKKPMPKIPESLPTKKEGLSEDYFYSIKGIPFS